MEAKSLYQRVVSAVNACTAASSADWLDTALFAQLVEAITDFVRVRCLELSQYGPTLYGSPCVLPSSLKRLLLQAGLKGNRAVEPNFWSVVSAMTRAFPVLLGPCWSHATSGAVAQDNDLAQLWLVQALVDGSLISLCCKLPSQPHIASAYDKHAPMRSSLLAGLQDALQPLQDVRMHSLLHEALQVRLKSAELVTDSHMDPHTDSHNSLRTGPHTAPHTISLSQSQANIFQPIANSSTSPTLKFLQEADQLNAEQSITGVRVQLTVEPLDSPLSVNGTIVHVVLQASATLTSSMSAESKPSAAPLDAPPPPAPPPNATHSAASPPAASPPAAPPSDATHAAASPPGASPPAAPPSNATNPAASPPAASPPAAASPSLVSGSTPYPATGAATVSGSPFSAGQGSVPHMPLDPVVVTPYSEAAQNQLPSRTGTHWINRGPHSLDVPIPWALPSWRSPKDPALADPSAELPAAASSSATDPASHSPEVAVLQASAEPDFPTDAEHAHLPHNPALPIAASAQLPAQTPSAGKAAEQATAEQQGSQRMSLQGYCVMNDASLAPDPNLAVTVRHRFPVTAHTGVTLQSTSVPDATLAQSILQDTVVAALHHTLTETTVGSETLSTADSPTTESTGLLCSVSGSRKTPSGDPSEGPHAAAGSPGWSDAPAQSQLMTPEQRALLAKGIQLGKQVQQALGDVKSAGRAIDAEPLGSDSAVVASLCTRLVGMLSHGLKPFAPKAQNTGWASYLPQRKGTPFAMLQGAERAISDESVLGVQAVLEMASKANDDARLHMWLRAGLNEGCLGARLCALWTHPSLYEPWYDRWALILQAEAVSGLFQDALPGLDLLSFSLPIETPPVLPAAVAANALLTSVGDLFRRQQSHYRTSTSQAPSSAVQSKSSRRDESAAHQPRSDAPSKRRARTVTFDHPPPASPWPTASPRALPHAASDPSSNHSSSSTISQAASRLSHPAMSSNPMPSLHPNPSGPLRHELISAQSPRLHMGSPAAVQSGHASHTTEFSIAQNLGSRALMSATSQADHRLEQQQVPQQTVSTADFLDAIILEANKGVLFKTTAANHRAPDAIACHTAADGPIEQRFHARDEDTDVTGQQPIAALLTMSQAEDQSEVHPEASSYKRVDLVGRADLLERAISRGSSLREGDFTSLLLPGTTTNVTELGVDLTADRTARSNQPNSPATFQDPIQVSCCHPSPTPVALSPQTMSTQTQAPLEGLRLSSATPAAAVQPSDVSHMSVSLQGQPEGQHERHTEGQPKGPTSELSSAATDRENDSEAGLMAESPRSSLSAPEHASAQKDAGNVARLAAGSLGTGLPVASYQHITSTLAALTTTNPATSTTATATANMAPPPPCYNNAMPSLPSALSPSQDTAGVKEAGTAEATASASTAVTVPGLAPADEAVSGATAPHCIADQTSSGGTPSCLPIQADPRELSVGHISMDGSRASSQHSSSHLANTCTFRQTDSDSSSQGGAKEVPDLISNPSDIYPRSAAFASSSGTLSTAGSSISIGTGASELYDILPAAASMQAEAEPSMQQLQAWAGMDPASSGDISTTISESVPSLGSELGSSGMLQHAALYSPASHADAEDTGSAHLSESHRHVDRFQSNVDLILTARSLAADRVAEAASAADSLDAEASEAQEPALAYNGTGNTFPGSSQSTQSESGVSAFQWTGPLAATLAAHVPFTPCQVSVTSCETMSETGFMRTYYTAYLVEVLPADGAPSWLVRRRFRDFINLKVALRAQAGIALSAAWDALSKTQAVRGQDRMAPDVVVQRQELLHTCMHDLLATNPQAPTVTPLQAFLDPAHITCPTDTTPSGSPSHQQSSTNQHLHPQTSLARPPERGSRIQLLTDLPLRCSDKELMLRQHGRCAGCDQILPPLQSSWLGRASSSQAATRCEYTGQLYCNNCHKGDTFHLPAAVLHQWDFTRRPVCVMAAEFLEATADQPLLCLGAINLRLYARIPLLGRAHEMRKQAWGLLTMLRDHSSTANAMVEEFLAADVSRRRLLDEADFWALSDLQQLKQGLSCPLFQWLTGAADGAYSLSLALTS